MRQMTLRDIPDEIEMLARDEASRQGVSLNKAFLSLLRKSAQQSAPQSPVTDNLKRSSRFSRFIGVWSDAEAAEFLGELLAGFKRGSIEQENKSILKIFLSISNVGVLNIDDSTAERYAIILNYLKKCGTQIPTNDIWIAASAMQNGLGLLTAVQHFSLLPQIVSETMEV